MTRPNHIELQHIFQKAPILILGVTRDGTTVFANPAVKKITGYAPGDLLGKNCWKTLYPGKEYPQAVRLLKNLEKGEIRDYAMTLTTRTGEKRHISWDSVNVYDSKNRLQMVICVGRDITESLILEGRAKKEKRRLYNMLTALGAGLVLLDGDMKILWANKLYTDWFGDIKSIKGKYCFCLFPRRDLACEYCPVLESKRAGAVFERTAFTKDGRERLFRLITTPIKDERGRIIRNLVLSIDITEQKELERRLLQTERLATIGEIATVMAHEIRNPLTPIGGFARYLKKKMPHDPLVQKSVDAIIRETSRLERMVEGIEGFTRTSKIRYVETDLNRLVERSLAVLSSEIETHKIVTDPSLADDLPQVPMDPDLIGRVLIHLLRNSVQAMPNGGRLTVTTSRKGRFAEVRVTDTGPGIEKEDASQIFQAFFSRRGGLGIGLTISSRIVQDHGGRISVDRRKGKGAVFIVELPLEKISFPRDRLESYRPPSRENEKTVSSDS